MVDISHYNIDSFLRAFSCSPNIPRGLFHMVYLQITTATVFIYKNLGFFSQMEDFFNFDYASVEDNFPNVTFDTYSYD